jgi:hypothetical protein
LIGEKISKKDTAFREAISIQESLALTLRLLASGDSYVSLQYVFKSSKQAISSIVPEACKSLVEKLNGFVQVRQILLFVVYERSLKLYCNQNIYLTFKNRASHIEDGRTATLQMFHYIYFFSTNIGTEYFKHATHSPFFSSKCRLFHNATFFGSCIIYILHTGCAKI